MNPAAPTGTVGSPEAARGPRTRALVVVGLLVSALLAAVVSFYASGHPDGLMHVAGTLGFDATERRSATAGSPLAGYAVSDVSDPRLSGGLAGLAGVVVVGLLMAGVVLVLRRRGPTGSATTSTTDSPS